MNLIIVESPTKARTLSRFLGTDYRIEATMGHVRDLPQKKFGIKTDKDFEPDYVLVPGKQEIVDKLKELAKKAKKVYLATDPDREGEAIAWHVDWIIRQLDDQIIGDKKKKSNRLIVQSSNSPSIQRIFFHEITQSAIEHAIKNPREIDMDLVNAQQARRILDRIVGYKLSPLLWFKIRKGLSAGRVQSVAVRLIVDREREIEKFVPVEYWEIYTDLKKHLGGKLPDAPVFSSKLVSENGQKLEIRSQQEAEVRVEELNSAGYEVQNIEKKEVKRTPPPPFTTSTLQQQAANRLGWPAKKTMRAAQGLYEKGLITYHRTDSTNIAKEAIFAVRDFIVGKYGKDFLPLDPRFYKTKSKVAQEAHEAIRPTNASVVADGGDWDDEEKRLYDIIWKRFVACQMAEAIYDETKLSVLATSQVNHYDLESLGRIVKFPGWLTLYGKKEGEGEGETQLPPLEIGDELDLVKVNSFQKFTQPPPRYNEASLIKTLEEYGIGRPSTYAPTISTIQDRQYVEKTEGKFIPTSLGFAVNDFLVEYFPDIFDYQFTAQMEDGLDEIANGKKEWVPVIRDFYVPFNTKLIGVSRVAERVSVEVEVTDEKCPNCGAPLVIRTGRFGKFLSCSRFPDCKFTKPYVKDAGFACPKCGAPVVIKKSKKGRTFFGCSKWPACDFATWRKPR